MSLKSLTWWRVKWWRIYPIAALMGVIINILSLSQLGKTGQSNYAASNVGPDATTRMWTLGLAPAASSVGVLMPGLVDTPILKNISGGSMKELP